MSGFFRSSVGQKFLMSITGMFLLVFLLVHSIANSFLLFGPDAFNKVSHFMETNPLIQIMQFVLAAGFIIHITWSVILSLQNMKARPQKYEVMVQAHNSKWASRNMFILGSLIAIFLVMHLMNFFWKMKFTGSDLYTDVNVEGVIMHNAYALVSGLFIDPELGLVYSLLYILGAVFLGLHLYHGFWSSFQTLGLSNNVWRIRLERIGIVYTLFVTMIFIIIPLYFLIFK
ncbi:MAG: succinate dehydrogenase cytochrome b subunit [Bacteroidales bacterium]